jgi:hypothetical protein
MPKFFDCFDNLIKKYRTRLKNHFVPCKASKKEMLKAMREIKNEHGVYLFWKNHGEKREKLIYIGSAGKIRNDGKISRQTVKERIANSTTPYKFKLNSLHYATNKQINCSKIAVEILVWNKLAPSLLEHLLLQSYLNQNGRLPDINREL